MQLAGWKPQSFQCSHFVCFIVRMRLQVSLLDVVPSMCVADLTRILEDYGRRR
jgi:hypothetical protein